jgi:ankyrin repeat protein
VKRVDWSEYQSFWTHGSLHEAIAEKNDARLASLIASSVDMNRTERGMTALHVACERWNVEAVRQLVSNGANLDAPGPGGWTPLALAVARSTQKGTEIIEILVAAGADPDKASDSGETPRSVARALDANTLSSVQKALEM